jgi:hypothetical protein
MASVCYEPNPVWTSAGAYGRNPEPPRLGMGDGEAIALAIVIGGLLAWMFTH